MRVPKLRFPEFRDAPEWEETTIGDLFDTKEKHEKSIVFDKQKIITVKLHALGVIKNERTDALTGGTNYLIRNSGQFIFSKIDLLNGAFGLVPPELNGFYSSSDVPALTFKQENIPVFFLNWMMLNYKKLNIERTGTSSTLKRISTTNLLDIPVRIPRIAEQQKIADCLASLDDVIAAQAQKLNILKTHKKGLMQQLFPAEGETVPKLRFPEFRDAPEWGVKKLEEIASFYKGKSISKADVDQQGKIPCIRYGELYTHYHEVIDTILSKTNLPISELVFSCKNDVIIPSSGETKLDIAIASCVMVDGVALGGDINIIRCNQNGIFISYYLNGCKKMGIAKIAQGDTVVHLYSSQLKLLDVMLPTLSEQQKISDCLSSLDELITAQTQKLDTLKTHKKGLMQQLFPSMDDGVAWGHANRIAL